MKTLLQIILPFFYVVLFYVCFLLLQNHLNWCEQMKKQELI